MGNSEATPRQPVHHRRGSMNYSWPVKDMMRVQQQQAANPYNSLQLHTYNTIHHHQQQQQLRQQQEAQLALMPYMQQAQVQTQEPAQPTSVNAYNQFHTPVDQDQKQRRHSSINVNWELQNKLYPKFPSGATNYEMHSLYSKTKENNSRHSLYSEKSQMGSMSSQPQSGLQPPQTTNHNGHLLYNDLGINEPSLVLEQFLYLGGHWSLNNPDLLNYIGITHVLNMAAEMPVVTNVLLNRNIRVKTIRAVDSMDYYIRNDFESAFSYIDKARDSGRKILVNCVMGVSRSATICIGYIMSRYRVSYQSAYDHVRSIRPQIRPNRYFRQQLLNFDQELMYSSYNNAMYHGTRSNTERSSRHNPSSSMKASNSTESSSNSRSKSKYKHKSLLNIKQHVANKKQVRFRL